MYDWRGIAIPLSFDHKPQQVRERKRIHDAGGFIAFRGVWRVAGVLATSRALGDYPLKDKVGKMGWFQRVTNEANLDTIFNHTLTESGDCYAGHFDLRTKRSQVSEQHFATTIQTTI